MSKGSHPLNAKRDTSILLTAKLVGAGGTSDLVVSESNGEVLTAVYDATGVYNITFRDSYPELKSVMSCPVVGTTDGLFAMFSEIDIVAKTAVIEFYVGSTKTVLAATDTCYINLLVRNSGANS